MVEVIELPPGKEPKQQTVHYYSQSLYEHFVAFQNQNNKNGFMLEMPTITIELIPVEKIITLEDVSTANCLLLFAQHEYVTEEQFKEFRQFIQKKMTVPGVHRARMCHTYEMLSHLFGYRTHSALKAYARQHIDKLYPGMIRNFRTSANAAANALFDSYGKDQIKKKLKSVPEVKQAFKEGLVRKNQNGAVVTTTFKKTRKIKE